jgi:O-antigen/teichoic acid export membrane protein
LWVLSFVSMGLIILLANLLSFSDELRHSTYLAGLAVIISFSGLGYSAVLRAFEEMEWDILGFVLQRLINIALVWVLMNTDLGLRGVFGTLFLANGFQYLYYWSVVRILHGRAALTFDFRA